MKSNVRIYIGRNKQESRYEGDMNFNERLVQFAEPGKDFYTFKYSIKEKGLEIEPAKYFSLYGSISKQLRWYEITPKIEFLTEFLHWVDENLSDTYNTDSIMQEINTLQQQKLTMLAEQIFALLKIPSSMEDGQEV